MRAAFRRLIHPLPWLLASVAGCAFGDNATPLDDSVPTDAVAAPDAPSLAPPPGKCPHPSWCPTPSTDWTRDLLATDLHIDLASLRGSAEVTFVPSITSTGLSLDVHGLVVRDVRGPLGPLQYAITDGRLDVGVPLGTVSMQIDYDFTLHDEFDGYMSQGMTFLWPYFCGNLFPCKPETADGVAFTLDVTGVPEGEVAVYPRAIPWEAPSYMIALAHGDYAKMDVGVSKGGTRLVAWHLPGREALTKAVTAPLPAAFSFFEETYGPYVFGEEAGPVEVAWPSPFGGMEHHPLWHVGAGSWNNWLTHIHEAAHGWFGNGVRMRCWEDFVLSEGSANYLAARAVEVAMGQSFADLVWSSYQRRLDVIVSTPGFDTIAWPDTCNQIDLLHHPLWSSVPYIKGAFFLRAVEQRVGRAAFDRALAVFYIWHVGKAASMGDLIHTMEWLTGAELDDLVQGWLKSLGAPPH